MALVEESLTYKVIGAAFAVHNGLGAGFLENVYAGALAMECTARGLHVERECPLAVHYRGTIVGTFRVDLLVEGRLIVEVKACPPDKSHLRQLHNYLRCSEVEVGLLVYFVHSLLHKRFVLRRGVKQHLRS